MKDMGDTSVIETLKAALSSEQLPDAARTYAEHLHKRLASPVRVSLLGLPHSGKSLLINMFIGEPLIKNDLSLPTTEFVYGETPELSVTFLDGAVRTQPVDTITQVSAANAAFLKVTAPAKMLERVSLLEVVTDGSETELQLAVDWAVKRTDIALWCTQEFGALERELWSRVPDALKDHAFLVLTKADLLSAERKLAQRISALEAVVAEEFHSLFAVASRQAMEAQLTQNEPLLHASGGGALIAEILRHAERGRRADFDSAQLFMARYHLDEVAPSRSKTSQPVETTPTFVDVDKVPKRGADDTGPTEPTPVAEIPVAMPTHSSSQAAPVEAVLPEPLMPAEEPKLFADAVRFVTRRADTISDTPRDPDDLSPVIDQCSDMVEYLNDLMSQDDVPCDAVDETLDDLAEAQDMLVLMQVESDATSAADALTLMLQLKREMEARIAA